MCRPQDNLGELVLSLHHVGTGDGNQVIGPGSKSP